MLRRIVLGILAGLFIVAAGALGALAGWGQATFGSGQPLRLEAGSITPGAEASATIIDIDRFDATIPYLEALGDFRLAVQTTERGDPSDTLFLGAADTAAVDEYLKGTPYTVAFRDGGDWEVREVPGARGASFPREQGIWLAESVGRPAAIAVPSTRPLTLVIMHPAGLPTGPLRLTIDFSVTDAATWILGLAIAAGVLLLVGLVFLVLALRSRRRVGRHESGDAAVPVAVATTAAVPAESVPVEPAPAEPVAEDSVPVEPAPAESVVPEESVPEESVVPEPAPQESMAAEPVAEDSVPAESVVPEPQESVVAEPVAEDSVPAESEAPDGGMGTEPIEPTPGPADPEAEGDPRAGT